MEGFSPFQTPDKSKNNQPNTTNTSSSQLQASGFPHFQHQQQQWFGPQPGFATYPPPYIQPGYQQQQWFGPQPRSQAVFPPPSFNQYTINSSSSQNTNVQNPEYQDSPESQECDAIKRVDYNRFVCADDEEDIVKETQLERKGKGLAKGGGRKQKIKQEKRIPWTPEEEKALLEGWIDVSENVVVGNAQDRVGFWKKITAFFHEKMGQGEYRTPDGLYSKFGPMNQDVVKFLGILSKHTNARQSGWSDKDIYTHSMNEFNDVVGKSFRFTHLVDIARRRPKWSSIPPFAPNAPKRAKTSETTSSGTQHIDLEDDDIPVFEEPSRPEHGKKKGGKLAAAARRLASSSSSQSGKEAKVDMLNETLNRIASLRQEQNDFKILGKRLEGYSGQELKVLKALKKRAMERNMKYIPEDDAEEDEE